MHFFADQTAQKQDCIVHADAHEAFNRISERTRVRRKERLIEFILPGSKNKLPTSFFIFFSTTSFIETYILCTGLH